jgi:Fe-S-cluster containining protein
VLSLEARPLVCRLYPLAYTEAGLGGSDEEYCPTWLLAADGRSMETVLEIDRTQARAWHAQLYDELHRGQP